MIARKDAIEKIVKYASTFVQEVKGYVAIDKFDSAIYAESTLIPILNAVFEINLTNANQERKNYPAVDLIDRTNRVAFQITVTSGQEKVNSTLEKFIAHKLHLEYDNLYIYVLTEKNEKYSRKKLVEIAGELFDADKNLHVIDFKDILQKINGIISSERINAIARIYEQEFSNVQIEARSKKFKDGFLSGNSEQVYLNMVKVHFSHSLYVAEPVFDKEVTLRYVNYQRRKEGIQRLKFLSPTTAFHYTLIKENYHHVDWIIFENKLFSFRDIGSSAEGLSKFVDKGTVECISPSEFYEISDDHLKVFKGLLLKCLRHLVYTKGMEWVGDKKIIRFRNDDAVPREMKTIWKGKRESSKTVIFEVMSKKKPNVDPHITCFRSMAFKSSFHLIGMTWYLSINPTWSFTDPGGQKTSKYESDYLTGLKRLENNNSVYYQFRFFAYFLSNTPPLFVEQYPHLKVINAEPTDFSPAILDEKWLPLKEFGDKNEQGVELFNDTELKANMF